MNEREILTRFKAGTLDRQQAARLLTGAVDVAVPAAVAEPETPRVPPVADRPAGAAGAVASGRTGAGDAVVRTAPATGGDPKAAVDDRYAVVGIAGRYPSASDVDAYWENLREGRDTSAPAPVARPGDNPLAEGQRGYFVDGAADFDPEFFGVTAARGTATDPQERLFLEVVWEALEDAGCTGSRLDALTTAEGAPRAVGVFAGVGSFDYALLAAAAWANDAREMPAGGHGGPSGTAAGLLGLTGPAQAVDTAECSALTAVHLAVGALRRGECAAAVAGGVELLLHPSRARDGAGEGVGAVVLKPLARALADGDRIHAVLRDTFSGFGPRRPGPVAAGRGGTGQGCEVEETRESTAARTGHAGAATGIAALTAAVLQVRHGVLVPRDGAGAGAPWPRATDARGRELPRTAGVEVSADGGHVAGVVVEEHLAAPGGPPRRRATGEDGARRPELVLLSAPTPAHLAATAGRLADWLDGRDGHDEDGAGRLAGVARALRGGRAALPCRIAVLVRDVPHLVAVLRRVTDGGDADAGGVLRWADLRGGAADPLGLNEVPETRDYLAALWREGRLEQLSRLWLQGVDVDWGALETAVPGEATQVVPPPSVLLRRPLWLGAGREAGAARRSESAT
ncbi:polyketide synthase [Streptomyces sp. NPDC093586]|uniref:beta-ketoacyl [acyl carrier protein] synthase domain-containing protein n=1 Tax=Streptomyces sp. NPDC093586 TaxID=3366042 RepID=UPI00380683F9